LITAQVIDTALGRTAALVPVLLDRFVTDVWEELGQRVTGFGEHPGEGLYRLTFDVAAYQAESFFPTIGVTFEGRNNGQDCHMALLLSPFADSVSRL
jgi:5-hydroxyisourate hydrolase